MQTKRPDMPTDRAISKAHRVLGHVVGFIRLQVDMMAGPRDLVGLSRLLNGVNYMRWYGGVAHHAAEHVLFERLLEKEPSARDLCQALADQHGSFEAREREIMNDICYACDGDSDAFARLRDEIVEYCYIHIAHIEMEEAELLPLARKSLSSHDWQAVQASFEAAAAR
ncbi:MAG TPA: hemerythrin domain-containing protein, partial [Gammaproteobacteria bacterium]|nr:hemerythrin domain-containing protein [Gammaproteobacteria bacterium]